MSISAHSPTPNFPNGDPHSLHKPGGDEANNLTSTDYEDGINMLETKEYVRAESIEDRSSFALNPQLAIDPNIFANTSDRPHDRAATLEEIALAIESDLVRVGEAFASAKASPLGNRTNVDDLQVVTNARQPLNRSPQDLSPQRLQEIAAVKTNNYRLALARCDLRIELDPQDPQSYYDRGICYDRLKEYTNALADFDKALELKPQDAVFHHARGRIHQQLGNFSAALSDYELVIQSQPSRASVYNDRAEIYRLQGDFLRAIADCERAINLNPLLVDAYFRRGITYTESGNLDLALVDYELIIAIDPSYIKAYIQRSWIYFRQGNYRQAIQDCESIETINKSCFTAHYLRGVIYERTGFKQLAIVSFAMAIALDPSSISALYYRGAIYYEMGRYPESSADIDRARALQQYNSEKLVDRDETSFYAEGLALYYTDGVDAAMTILRLGFLTATRFSNYSFREYISLRL
ncbi:tetratricopeptide repeat protein [Chamaesiphon polymorphus]|nr:tetratricopeptide repeat protein [Chamaesiphon polymorphus]